MLERIKKMFLVNIVLALLVIIIQPVFAYDFINVENEEVIKRDRRAIYDLVDLYYDIVGKDNTNFSLMNYNGVCSTVTISSGNHAGTYQLEEYIAGVVSQEIGGVDFEAQKAQAVAARSYLIGQMKNKSTCTIPNSEGFQTFKPVSADNSSDQQFIRAAEETAGMVVMHNGEVFITYYSSSPANSNHNIKSANSWKMVLQKDWTKATEWTLTLNASKSAVCNYGWCGADGGGHSAGMSQIAAAYLAGAEGYSYEKLLELFYKFDDKYSLGYLSDGDYVGNMNFLNSSFGQIRYFNQGDYSDYYYSSNVNVAQYGTATIRSHGCGPTAMSIVLSSFENKNITPITTTQRICQLGGCTSSGTYFNSLKTLAEEYGYKATIVSRDERAKVISALQTGNALVVALMGPGTFTKGGHYIVLTGTRADGYISVADPGSRDRTNKEWFDANTIFEQVKTPSSFMIVTK